MESKPNLRFEFVEMLFALAIGQVGIEVGDLVMKESKVSDSFFLYPYAYTHLLLGTFILTLSWIGWQHSKSIGNSQVIISIFSLPFLILLIDIFLVFCYFIIVRGAEIPSLVEGNIKQTPASSINETQWTLMIFGAYLVWDVFTKLVVWKIGKVGTEYRGNLHFDFRSFWRRGWQTIICVLVAIFIWTRMDDKQDSRHVVIVDLCLISLFWLFRGLKQKIKKKYKLDENEISPKNLAQLNEVHTIYPIVVTEQYFLLKIIALKIAPAILIIGLYIWYTLV